MELARKNWIGRGHEPVSINVTWKSLRHDPPQTKQAVASLADRLVDAVAEFLPDSDDARIVSRRDRGWKVLPPEVSVLGIYPGIDEGWNTQWASPIPRLESGHIQRECSRKLPRVAGYREHCDEIWLVIWVDWSAPGSSFAPPRPDESGGLRVSTAFDRVFFLDTDSLIEIDTGSSFSPVE